MVVNYFHSEEYWENGIDMLRRCGLQLSSETALKTHPGYVWRPESTLDFHHVKEGDVLHVGKYDLKCIVTPGHTPGHTCLYDEDKKIFFAGDMILGDITPNLCPERFNDSPLTLYLNSLDKIEKLNIDTVFVGHRSMLSDLTLRIESLRKHHRDRYAETLQVLEQGSLDAWEAAQQMTCQINAKDWESFPPSQKWFACGDAQAHLIHLYEQGKVLRKYRPDGVAYFELIK